ncbi:hypothetical protein COMNV_01156 [Commensalibacter sp. Nvir]|uniref:GtrA family protein n=1 Tax=Commensalibacter sp. Nvir TaxID=3069817 RepID=UPI002D6F87B4|nr:hypothetical protein COMNV_01156 [Commensalibacter sp. Nvir]
MRVLTLNLQLIKYVVVGLANTLVTAIVIFTLMHLGTNLYTSNAMGYIIGIIFSFVVNSKFTFITSLTVNKFAKFIIVCFFCYLCNLAAIKLFLHLKPQKLYEAQLVGMCFYTAIGFFLNKYWSMK